MYEQQIVTHLNTEIILCLQNMKIIHDASQQKRERIFQHYLMH